MAKNIPGKEFKEAIKSFNEVLKAAKSPAIKFVGVKKEAVLKDFIAKVLGYIDNDKVAELPDDVIDFYNNHIVEEDPKDSKKKKEKPKKKPEKKEKKKQEKKEKKVKAPGIVMLSVKAYMEDGCKTAKDIVDHIQPNFPDRNISKTVSHCYGVLKHITPLK